MNYIDKNKSYKIMYINRGIFIDDLLFFIVSFFFYISKITFRQVFINIYHYIYLANNEL